MSSLNRNTILLITVAALGYFVDIYDLILFNVVKKESLISLGITDPAKLKSTGIMLFNWQMGGMLLGGLLWGILGDKKGRIKVLFGSILMYSVANIANAFVTDIPQYAAVRFIAGIGLAGELGAGITLVTEVMKKEHRGYGTMIIVTFGALGAVLASWVGAKGQEITEPLQQWLSVDLENWQLAYWIGGVLGLMLLVMRAGALESKMYRSMSVKEDIKKGDFLAIFRQKPTAFKYLRCIAIGLPIWFVIGVLIALGEQFAAPEVLNIEGEVITGTCIMYAYLGLSAGDLLSGLMSQLLRSRRRVVFLYLAFCMALVLAYFFDASGRSADYFYLLCFMLGCASGYWALFVTIAAEQFGTNIRSTVATTVPNFVRGSVIPITLSYKWLEPIMGTVGSALLVGTVCIALAFWATLKTRESFHLELNYHETL